MILKIDQDRYINTDHILCVFPADDKKPDTFTLLLSNAARLIISGEILDYIMDCVEANVGFTDNATQIPIRPLTSRVASLLQNQTNGLTFTELMTLLGSDPMTDEEALTDTLEALVKENLITIKRDGAPGFEWHWYHNANSGRKTKW